MTTQAQVNEMEQGSSAPRWNALTRIAFRFCFVYLGLFVLYFCPVWLQYLLFPKNFSPLALGGVWPMRQMVFWASAHIFHMSGPPDHGVGFDGSFFWVQAFCCLVISAVATAIWSFADRGRPNYVVLLKWFRLVIRFVLAGLMFAYGVFKAIPAQMPYPNLFELVRPFGHFLQIQVLWTYMGAAPAYEIFAGCAEVLGGILLLVPRTATLGALICLADLTNVFVIDMSYNVANKLEVFNFLLLALFLLAPELSRLANVFLFNRGTLSSPPPQLFRTRRANRVAMVVQIVVAIYLVGATVYDAWKNEWLVRGSTAPKPTLYGIWDVEQFSIDGQVRPPLLTDHDRFRRVIFDSGVVWELNLDVDGGAVAFQRLDDSFSYYRASVDDRNKTLTLTEPGHGHTAWNAHFTFERPAADQLILDGDLNEHKLHMQLHLFDRNKFELVSSSFHWVQ